MSKVGGMEGNHILLDNPPLKEAYRFLRKGLAGKMLVFFIADCEVSYRGRARSHLSRGERLIVIKPDGSLLIHRDKGYEPVNWQPPDTVISTRLTDNHLLVKSVRKSVNEVVEIHIFDLKVLGCYRLKDIGTFTMYGREEDMKKAIEMFPSLIEEGFKVLRTERKVRPGFIDVFGVDSQGRLTVVELKSGTSSMDAVLQLKKYVDSLKKELGVTEIRGILASPRITKRGLQLLKTLKLEYKPLSPAKCLKYLERKKGLKL